MAVRKVAAMGEVESQNRVARLEQGHVRSHIGLRARMRLDVGMFGGEELLGAIARQVLYYVCELTAAIVTLAGITLRVLVGENGAGSLQHRQADKILRRDQLQPF